MRSVLRWIAVSVIGCSMATAVIRCGEKVCSSFEYCSENAFCTSCNEICESSSNNYDLNTCQLECKEYLNTLYVRREDFESVISRVYTYVAVSLIVSSMVLVSAITALFTGWLKYRRIKSYKHKEIKKKVESIKAVCVNEVDGGKKLKLEMPGAVPAVDKSREQSPPSALTTMTPLSTRHPAEDATLEYAYDNPTLNHSPIFPKNHPQSTPNTTPKTTRTETSF